MKILQINSFFSVGGPPRIVNGIYDTLLEMGHECKIAAAREKMYAPENSIRIGSKFSIKINALKSRLFDNEGFSAKRATKKLIQEIEAYDPDVIHLHNLHGYYVNIKTLFNYLKRAGKPVVWTLHDCWSITGHCAHFDYVRCDKWKTACKNCPQSKEYPKSFIKDNSRKNYQRKKAAFCGVKNMTLVTPSEWLAELVKESFMGSYPIKVIRNGIDILKFSRQDNDLKEKYGLTNKNIVLGVAQNWGEHKGLEDFEQLSKILSKEYQIVLIGITERQKKLTSAPILCLPRTEKLEELVAWYSVADVFVNLTYQDTFPTVNIEAQCCGTPVVTYKTGGSPESVPQDYWVEQGDLSGIATAVYKICSGDDQIKIYPVDNFNRKTLYLEYVKLYELLYTQKD